jgi:carbon-monoxide dehydrogenase small subunit
MKDLRIHLTVNGEVHDVAVDPRQPLVHVLRDTLEMTGTHAGCLTGHCGACTVRLDGHAVKACTVLAAAADGAHVETIEGMAHDGRLHPLQQAFWDCFGFQCGFCTPGMIMTARDLLDEQPAPTASAVREALSGNLCRCTGYQSIIDAVLAAAAELRARAPGETDG